MATVDDVMNTPLKAGDHWVQCCLCGEYYPYSMGSHRDCPALRPPEEIVAQSSRFREEFYRTYGFPAVGKLEPPLMDEAECRRLQENKEMVRGELRTAGHGWDAAYPLPETRQERQLKEILDAQNVIIETLDELCARMGKIEKRLEELC